MSRPPARVGVAGAILVTSLSCAAGRTAPGRVDAGAAGAGGAVATRAAPVIAFEGATVVDVRAGRLLPNRTVVVVGNRIRVVDDAGKVRVPSGARVIPAHGTYAIPGLWDMHVHTLGFPNTFYPLFVANGVTGVREMSAISLDSARRWRREILAGVRVGPRTVTAGPMVMDTSYRSFPWRFGRPWAVFAATPADGRRLVDSLKRAGADFIKIYDGHSRETYFAVAAEARRLGMRLEGHLSADVSAAEASDSGQRSIEHYLACDTVPPGGELPHLRNVVHPRGCPALAARFAKNGTWFSVAEPFKAAAPGLTNLADLLGYWPDSILVADTTLIVGRASVIDSVRAYRGTGTSARERRSLAKWAEARRGGEHFYGDLQRAGVRMLAGTDTGPMLLLTSTVPGFSLHGMLWELVRQGLTPLEALQTATLNPAEFYGATDSLGTVEAGKLADLVFLDADPLQDIYNTRRVRAVVANGRFFDRGELDLLLLDVERLARRGRRNP